MTEYTLHSDYASVIAIDQHFVDTFLQHGSGTIAHKWVKELCLIGDAVVLAFTS